jgi:hypothetical protein
MVLDIRNRVRAWFSHCTPPLFIVFALLSRLRRAHLSHRLDTRGDHECQLPNTETQEQWRWIKLYAA